MKNKTKKEVGHCNQIRFENLSTTSNDTRMPQLAPSRQRLEWGFREPVSSGTGYLWRWVRANTLAQRLGISKDSLLRAAAGVANVLQELSGEGHCACAVDTLLTTTEKLLKISQPILIEAI